MVWPFTDKNGVVHPRPTIHSQDVTDHISGDTYAPNLVATFSPETALTRSSSFLVRSKADPRDFWHVPRRGSNQGLLIVSRKDRTRFRFTAKDAPAPLNGGPVVMIGSDTIEIAEAKTRRIVGIDSSGYLALGEAAGAIRGTMTELVVEERNEGTEQLVVEERGADTAVAPTTEVTQEGDQENATQIFFGDLKHRFAVSPEDDSRTTSPATRRLEVGDGEEWELV